MDTCGLERVERFRINLNEKTFASQKNTLTFSLPLSRMEFVARDSPVPSPNSVDHFRSSHSGNSNTINSNTMRKRIVRSDNRIATLADCLPSLLTKLD